MKPKKLCKKIKNFYNILIFIIPHCKLYLRILNFHKIFNYIL